MVYVYLNTCYLIMSEAISYMRLAKYKQHILACVVDDHIQLWFELCFYLMYVLESSTACCEAGVGGCCHDNCSK